MGCKEGRYPSNKKNRSLEASLHLFKTVFPSVCLFATINDQSIGPSFAVSNYPSIVIASAQGVPRIRMFRTPLAVPTLQIRKKEKRDAKVETTKIRVGKSLKKVKLDLSVAGVKCLCLRGHDGPLYTDELTWIRSNNKVELRVIIRNGRINFANTDAN